ncbi:conserved hypothetical bacterial protein [Acinetobacter phage Ac42]|uniref:conserved hypothetical bacterial protein n=1 Tax=Acinetobacter phage Ac42 TaxID=762660 RepID=UPI0001EBCE0A|nr:conserved hypothetical bacterial protein [Acinetobacter phage Ac42]ADI96462.1 conserved hypothetical bacterial protein [Acinetobacter phage Ac42]
MITIYSKPGCPNCDKAKLLVKMKSLDHEIKMLGKDFSVEDVESFSEGRKSFPIIYKDGKMIGGFEELKELV